MLQRPFPVDSIFFADPRHMLQKRDAGAPLRSRDGRGKAGRPAADNQSFSAHGSLLADICEK